MLLAAVLNVRGGSPPPIERHFSSKRLHRALLSSECRRKVCLSDIPHQPTRIASRTTPLPPSSVPRPWIPSSSTPDCWAPRPRIGLGKTRTAPPTTKRNRVRGVHPIKVFLRQEDSWLPGEVGGLWNPVPIGPCPPSHSAQDSQDLGLQPRRVYRCPCASRERSLQVRPRRPRTISQTAPHHTAFLHSISAYSFRLASSCAFPIQLSHTLA